VTAQRSALSNGQRLLKDQWRTQTSTDKLSLSSPPNSSRESSQMLYCLVALPLLPHTCNGWFSASHTARTCRIEAAQRDRTLDMAALLLVSATQRDRFN